MSKLGRQTSSGETQSVTNETKRKSLEMAQTVTADLVMIAIKSCRNNKAFGPDKLSIYHFKHLGPRAIEHTTDPPPFLQPLSHDMSDSEDMEVFFNHPNTDTWKGQLPRNFISAHLCPAAKVLESLILPTITKYLQPAPDQHGFKPDHSTTSALLQLTTDIAMGFNQNKPTYLTVYIAVDCIGCI